MALKYCPHCGTSIAEENWAFCPSCSGALKEAAAIASAQELQPRAPRQAQQKNVYMTIASDKSRDKALQLCAIAFALVILGWLTKFYLLMIAAGAHRYYVGKIVTGIMYTLTGGFLGIGLVWDIVNIYTGQFTDNTGQPLRERRGA